MNSKPNSAGQDKLAIKCPCAVNVDGLDIIVRQLRRDDRALLESGFEELSKESRIYRFLSPINELPDRLADHLTDIDHDKHEAWVAGLDEDGTSRPIGVSRYVRETTAESTAEFALTVIDDYQHRGVGSMLFYILATSAEAHGVGAFSALVHGENKPMQKFIAKFGGRADGRQSGATTFTVSVSDVVHKLSGEYEFREVEDR